MLRELDTREMECVSGGLDDGGDIVVTGRRNVVDVLDAFDIRSILANASLELEGPPQWYWDLAAQNPCSLIDDFAGCNAGEDIVVTGENEGYEVFDRNGDLEFRRYADGTIFVFKDGEFRAEVEVVGMTTSRGTDIGSSIGNGGSSSEFIITSQNGYTYNIVRMADPVIVSPSR